MIHYRGNRRKQGYQYRNTRSTSPWIPVLVLAGILLAAFLLFRFTGVGGVDQNNFASQRNAKLRSELQLATASTNRLSRLGASTTTIELARIRQYIHGMELLNDLNVSMYGEVGRLYAQSVFDNLYSILDTYDAKLASGQKVNDSLTALTEAITNLTTLTGGVLGFEDAQ